MRQPIEGGCDQEEIMKFYKKKGRNVSLTKKIAKKTERKRIAIVDDSEMMLHMLKRLTPQIIDSFDEKAEIHTLLVKKVTSTIEEIKRIEPDLLLLDHNYEREAGGCGFDIAEAIQGNGLSRKTKIVSISQNDMKRAYAEKFDIEFVSKENHMNVINRIEEFLSE